MAALIDRRQFVGAAAAVFLGSSASARASGPPIRGPVIRRGSRGFAAAAHIYNERFDYVQPLAVAFPLDAGDVRAAIRWATARGIRLRARSGGHSYAGYSTIEDGLVLDLGRMRGIHVDRGAGQATVGAGARLIDVYTALAAHGATIPAGSCPGVGIAGVTLGGGTGLSGRAFGLTADSLAAAKLVTADGRLRTVTRGSDADLLWALRGGGGGNFGVATELTFRLHRIPRHASWFGISWPWSSASDALAVWQAWAPHAREELTSTFDLSAGGGQTFVTSGGQYLGPAADLPGLLRQLTAVPGAALSTGENDYLSLQRRWAGCLHQSCSALPRDSFHAKSDYVSRPLSTAARSTLTRAMESRVGQPGSAAIICDSYGGAINRVAPHATAFVHRNDLFSMQYLTYGEGAGWLGQTHAAMRPYVSGFAYQNYIDSELSTWRHAYYGSNYERLVHVQRRVDPHHFFRFPQAIGR